MSYQYDIGEKGRRVARFLGKVRRELQAALEQEKTVRKLTQQQIANMIGVNRSVINRQLLGGENLTLRRVAELAWALGWEIVFELRKPAVARGQNYLPTQAFPVPSTTEEVSAAQPELSKTKASDVEPMAAA
jgi:transcriptional regulator with XRE-family HTH domain